MKIEQRENNIAKAKMGVEQGHIDTVQGRIKVVQAKIDIEEENINVYGEMKRFEERLRKLVKQKKENKR